uniref:Uncharacterized protein LOC100184462 n=1 Tax=Phallusia mammillata TaxID=59560 RepID=A0A6F9DIZ1_9ASCI|nr:uncharacterized protein LOC100184462 [Phallusia mammillata]
METQLASAIWVPTFCHLNTPVSYHDTSPVAKQQFIHPAMLPGQQLIIPPANGHVMVHAPQQVVPILPQEAQSLLPCHDFLSQKLLIHPLQYLPSGAAPTTPTLYDASNQHAITKLQQIHSHLTTDGLSSAIHKTQRRKKVSPSAKRRSRLRLIAFLEAKKEKCRSGSCDGEKTDDRISANSSPVNSNSDSDVTTTTSDASDLGSNEQAEN